MAYFVPTLVDNPSIKEDLKKYFFPQVDDNTIDVGSI